MDPKTIKLYDGDDEIIFSNSFNIYNNFLRIEGVRGLDVTFKFDESSSENREKDVDILGAGNNAVVSFSSKIRNTLGSGTTGKTELAEIEDGLEKLKLFFSIYVSKIGDNSSGLNVNVTFYIKKI